jgi:hypothetical protein
MIYLLVLIIWIIMGLGTWNLLFTIFTLNLSSVDKKVQIVAKFIIVIFWPFFLVFRAFA